MRGVGLFVLLVLGAAPQAALEPIGRFRDPAIREPSGIVKSPRHPDIFWVHNDSANPASLFAVQRDGTLVAKFAVAIPNVDWEDIATDDRGHLFLGDIGNNDGRLPLRAIHELDEPDPAGESKTPLPVRKSSFYRFPKGARFDAESLYIERGRAVLIAKTNDQHDAQLYAIPLDPPAPLWKPAIPELIGRLPEFTEPATGCGLSPDGRWLAVCATGVARVYWRNAQGPWTLASTIPFTAGQVEAIGWDGSDLILCEEEGQLYRIRKDAWHPGSRPARGRVAPAPGRQPAPAKP